MAETAPTASMVLKRDPRRALIAAAVVAGTMLIEFVVAYLESFIAGGQGGSYVAGIVIPALFTDVLPKAAGVFLVLWLWPARAEERLLVLFLRAIVAALAGCVIAALARLGYMIIVAGLHFADYRALPYDPFSGLLSATVALAPLVMLVVLAQWAIRRGARP